MLALTANRPTERPPTLSWRSPIADVPTDGPIEVIFEALPPIPGQTVHWLLMRRRIARFCLQVPDCDKASYALVAECLMGQMKPTPSAPVRSENLEHYLTRYVDEYHRRGYSPREGGGRDEIILIQVCDRLRTTLRIWKIDRFPLTRTVRDFVAVDTGSGAETGFAGRFVNLLEGRVH
jgi:hypothetical protein